MSIYIMTGTEITEAYALNGTELQEAYDLNGNVCFEPWGVEYPIENVVSYFRQDTLAVAEEINALSDDWQSFVFVADSHQANKWHSAPIVMYLLANTKVRRFFHGGDCIGGSWSDSAYLYYFNPMIENGFTSRIYPAVGNHETFLFGDYTYASLELIYDTFLRKNELHGYPERYYYYFDDVNKKTRYICINTSDGAGNRVTQDQIDWITQTAQLPDSDWSLVVFGHIDIDPDNTLTGGWKSVKSAEITSALSACNGKVVGYFSGHEHIDQLRLVNNKFYQCICLCDVFENDNYYNVDNYPVRTAGTNTEQVVTVVSFNTTTGDVVTRRIGAGDEYAWNYKILQEVSS